eukprot:6875547-Pyramimonas_sp.AAC.1
MATPAETAPSSSAKPRPLQPGSVQPFIFFASTQTRTWQAARSWFGCRRRAGAMSAKGSLAPARPPLLPAKIGAAAHGAQVPRGSSMSSPTPRGRSLPWSVTSPPSSTSGP